MIQSLAQRGFAIFSFSAVIFLFLTYNAVVEREREENTMIDVVMFLSLSLSLFLPRSLQLAWPSPLNIPLPFPSLPFPHIHASNISTIKNKKEKCYPLCNIILIKDYSLASSSPITQLLVRRLPLPSVFPTTLAIFL